MSKSPQVSSRPENGNRFTSVLEAARMAHQAKAEAAIEARNARQQAFASELQFLLRHEGEGREAEA